MGEKLEEEAPASGERSEQLAQLVLCERLHLLLVVLMLSVRDPEPRSGVRADQSLFESGGEKGFHGSQVKPDCVPGEPARGKALTEALEVARRDRG